MFKKWNMKKMAIYLLAIMCVSFGIGWCILVSTSGGTVNLLKGAFISGKFQVDQEKKIDISVPNNSSVTNSNATNSNSTSQSGDVNQEKSLQGKVLKSINLEVSSADIIIIPEDRTDVKAQLTGRVSNKDAEPKLEMNIENDRLVISAKSKVVIGINVSSSLELKIYVPKNFEGSMQALTGSGDINIKDFKLKEFTGNVASGDLTIDNVTIDKFNFTSASGYLKGNNVVCKEASIKLISGDVELEQFKGQLKGSTTSGEIKVNYAEFNNDITLSSTSGDVKLSLPKASEFYLDARTTSGDVSCKFPITITEKEKDNVLRGTVKSDKNKISINVTSGDIDIK